MDPARGGFALHWDNHLFEMHCVDCVEGMRAELPSGSVDVVVTSPPYNLGTRYRTYDDTISRAEYLRWLGEWARVVYDVLSEQGSLFLNIGGKPSDPWGPLEVVSELRSRFVLQNVIHWIKSIAIEHEDVGNNPGIQGNISVGHYKPINSPRYVNDCHEYIFHLTKTGAVQLDRLAIGVEYGDKSNITRWGDGRRDLRCRGNTWFVPYRTIWNRSNQRPHPAIFPVKIPRMCIQLHGVKRTRRVLDPFAGLGNSALASIQLGVDFVGFELDPDYCAVAKDRIEKATSVRSESAT